MDFPNLYNKQTNIYGGVNKPSGQYPKVKPFFIPNW